MNFPIKSLLVFGFSATLPWSLKGLDTLETGIELLDSELFDVSLISAKAVSQTGNWELQTTVSRSDYDIDYRITSFDFFGEETRIREKTHSIAISASQQLREELTLDLGAGYRDGFPNYRSVWFDTYFDQQFGQLEGAKGFELYDDFEASAASLTAGLRWEYLPANGIASVTFSRIQDNVSPGYEIDFEGIRRGELVLATTSLSLVTENVLSERLRSRFALTATETSSRETRYAAEVAINAALGDHFIWRNKIGAATENPQFDAHFFDTAIEFQATESSAVYVQARHYKDTGEIENALLFSTAAPEMENDSISLGYRYANDKWTAKIAWTHSESDFATENQVVDFFQYLFTDSDWTNIQFALSKTF